MKKSYSGVTRTSSGRLRRLGDPTGPVVTAPFVLTSDPMGHGAGGNGAGNPGVLPRPPPALTSLKPLPSPGRCCLLVSGV
ncbi:Hypothetical predicted protein [Marmota monax]|uniref:Uncharacterized protein n=1 Tax=Marmota monax TaxID=9995 RepID=A0A5E4C7W1_MARMO|nr:Hypothetical predicted protein [Marmota monax]